MRGREAGAISQLVSKSISEEVKIRDKMFIDKMRFLETMSFKPPNLNTEVLVLNEAPQFRPEISEGARGTMSLKAHSNNERISDDFDRGRMLQETTEHDNSKEFRTKYCLRFASQFNKGTNK